MSKPSQFKRYWTGIDTCPGTLEYATPDQLQEVKAMVKAAFYHIPHNKRVEHDKLKACVAELEAEAAKYKGYWEGFAYRVRHFDVYPVLRGELNKAEARVAELEAKQPICSQARLEKALDRVAELENPEPCVWKMTKPHNFMMEKYETTCGRITHVTSNTDRPCWCGKPVEVSDE